MSNSQNKVRALTDANVLFAGLAFPLSADKDLTTQDETTEELRRHVKVILSGTFLREVMGWTSEELEAIRNRKWSDISENQGELSD